VAETCLPPHVHHLEFDSEYECLMAGYEESLNKIMEIGPEDVNILLQQLQRINLDHLAIVQLLITLPLMLDQHHLVQVHHLIIV
jgi:hypothetical protein